MCDDTLAKSTYSTEGQSNEDYSAEKAIDDFIEAITHHNPSIYANLGVTIKMAELPCAEIYHRAISAYFGHGILGRWWAKHIRPWLQPTKELALRAEYEKELDFNRKAFMDALLAKYQAGQIGLFVKEE